MFWLSRMAARVLTQDDIPGASLAGREPQALKCKELRFWLRCRGDSLKGLKTKAALVKRKAQDRFVFRYDLSKYYTYTCEKSDFTS